MSGNQFERQLRAARAGESQAYLWLWNAYAGPISGFLAARGTPDIDEVLNDVFVAAFAGLGRFEGGEAEFRSWLYRIARNKRVDAFRARSRRPIADESALVARGRTGNAEDDAIESLADGELRSVLRELTSDQRDVIVLRFVSDLALDQTAVVMDKPVSAVKALQHRALAQLRKKFSPAPYPAATRAPMS